METAKDAKITDWLDTSVNPDGTRIVEGSTEAVFVSWRSDEPGFIILDGTFTLAELRELTAMMETAAGKAA